MARRHERDLNVTLICAWCSKPFHPWTQNKSQACYCSKACRALAAFNKGKGNVPEPVPLPLCDTVPREYSTLSVQIDNDADGTNWRESGEHWDRVAAWYAERQAAQQRYLSARSRRL